MSRPIFIAIMLLCASISGCGQAEKTQSPANPPVQTDDTTGATGLVIRQKNFTQEEASDTTFHFLKQSPPYFIATLENGNPRLRPTDTVTLFGGRIWFHIGKQKGSYTQLQQHPQVEIVAYNVSREWIRISGKAVFSDSPEVHEAALQANPVLKKLYNADTGADFASFHIREAQVEIESKTKGNCRFRME